MSDQVEGQPDDGLPRGTSDGRGDGGGPAVQPAPPAPAAAPAPWQSPGTSAPDGQGRPAPAWQSPVPPPQGPGPQQPGQGWGPGFPPQGPQGPGPQQPGQGWGPGFPPPSPQGPGQGGNPYGARPFPQGPMYQAPPKPGVIPLRPLGLGEILDGAFQACRRNPMATFGSAILLQAVVALMTVLLLGNVVSSFEVLESETATTDSIIAAVAGFGVAATITGVVSAVALLVLQGILVIPIARAVINQRTSFGQAWRIARGRILPLLGFGLLSFAAGLVGLVLVVGISALAVVGLEEYSALVIVPLALGAVALLVWVSTKIVVAPATLMLEGTGPWTSVKRSWALTRGNWWRTFGIVLLTSLIVSIIASVISTPLTFAVSLVFGFSASASATPDALDSIPLLLATQAITALFSAIGYAFQAGVTSLLYVDLRIRREGFDVVLMREHERAGTGPSDILPGGTPPGTSFGHRPGGPA
jgi:hypothetical protein